MSPKAPSPEFQIADHERRLSDMEKALEGHSNEPGLIKRVRSLEDANLTDTVKRAMMSAGIALVVTAGPLLAVVLPKVSQLEELLKKQPAASGASAPAGRGQP